MFEPWRQKLIGENLFSLLGGTQQKQIFDWYIEQTQEISFTDHANIINACVSSNDIESLHYFLEKIQDYESGRRNTYNQKTAIAILKELIQYLLEKKRVCHI